MSTITTEERYQSFVNGYEGKNLLKFHTLAEDGVWEVIGEGDGEGRNAPTIGLFSGTLGDIIQMAIRHKDFWSWGRGGEIRKREVISVEENYLHKQALREQREKLLAEVAALDRQIEK